MAFAERRTKRSKDPLVALHYHLTSVKTREALEAVVVADASGVLVAGAGSWSMCEELAAYAPFLAGTMEPPASREFEALQRSSRAITFRLGSSDVHVCVRGTAHTAIDEVRLGVQRILGEVQPEAA